MGKPRTPSIYTSPQDAALAFYQAFEAKDVEAMMSTWADDEEIVCVHPGGPRLVGYMVRCRPEDALPLGSRRDAQWHHGRSG